MYISVGNVDEPELGAGGNTGAGEGTATAFAGEHRDDGNGEHVLPVGRASGTHGAEVAGQEVAGGEYGGDAGEFGGGENEASRGGDATRGAGNDEFREMDDVFVSERVNRGIMEGMGKHKRGFTLIEVVLFLAVTTALFVGIAVGVQGSIFQQRYTDAVQNFAEFLRSVYSQVSNVQNESTGRSDKAIYGKVITFREAADSGRGNVIRTYNLIGDVESLQSNGEVGSGVDASGETECVDNGTTLDRLKCLHANVVVRTTDPEDGHFIGYKPVGFVENYVPRWSSEIQTTAAWDGNNKKYKIYEGIIIVTHSPSSGNIATYVWADENELREIRDAIDAIASCGSGDGCSQDPDPFKTAASEAGSSLLTSSNFKSMDIDFCVNPSGYEFSNVRRNIRLSKGAHNASAVDVLTEGKDHEPGEDDYNKCE